MKQRERDSHQLLKTYTPPKQKQACARPLRDGNSERTKKQICDLLVIVPKGENITTAQYVHYSNEKLSIHDDWKFHIFHQANQN